MGNEEIVKYLLDNNVNTHVMDTAGRSPLDEARAKGYVNIVKLLEKFGN